MDKLAFIYTGGTIGGKVEQASSHISIDLKPKMFVKELTEQIPTLHNDVEFIYKTPTNKFSETIIPTDWMLIARSIDEAIREGAKGIVIAHGTDTMAYTAAALSYMLQGIKIPVILTGSNYPLMDKKTDAVKNLSDAVFVARQKELKGVFIVFAGTRDSESKIHLGVRVRKTLNDPSCYESINCAPIGSVKTKMISGKKFIEYSNQELLNKVVQMNSSTEYILKEKVNDNVDLFKIFPGFNPKILSKSQSLGIVLELYNSGTGCNVGSEKYNLVPNLKSMKVPVFVTSQHKGNVNMNTYGSSVDIKAAGVIPLKDMITEAAITKLMWVLGQTQSKEEIVNIMLQNLVNEIT